MKLFGLSAIRDEVDIIRTNVLYHLALGLPGRRSRRALGRVEE
jgi:hypothetical protein